MACKSCGQKWMRPGSSASTAIVLGEPNGIVYRVLVKDPNIVAGYPVNSYVYVKGTGVEPAIEEGLLEDTGWEQQTATSNTTVYCVGASMDDCYDRLADAKKVAVATGERIYLRKLEVA